MLIPINQTLSPFNNKIFQQSISDWWTIDLISPLVAYQPYGATSYANSLINLANPGTFDAGQFLTYNEPDWSALNGWEFNGNAILDSGLNFNLYEPYSFILKYSNLSVPSVQAQIIAVNDGTTNGQYVFTSSSEFRIRKSTNLYQHGSFVYSGVVGTNDDDVVVNGSITENVVSFTTFPNTTLKIGSGYYTSLQYPSTCYIQAFAAYNETLTGSQMQTLTTRLQGL